MADTQTVAQLKFKVSSLESALLDRQKELEECRGVEQQADGKIKAMAKMHAEKVKSLLNSLQMVKKEKAVLEGLSKEHKRSKLIEQLNREINDQDTVIEVLRKYVYSQQGKEAGRAVCDDIIVKALTKGPERIRPLTREQLRMEIEKLKAAYSGLESKAKRKGEMAKNNQIVFDGEISQISEPSEASYVNQNQEVLKRLHDFQYENERLKLEINAKSKIVESLRNDCKEKERLQTQLEMMVNEVELSRKKVSSYESLLKVWKETTNAKMVEVYERELKVEELEVRSKEDLQRVKDAHESKNMLLQDLQHQKEQAEADKQAVQLENEQIMLENISLKKQLDNLKNSFLDVKTLHERAKQDLTVKFKAQEEQINLLLADCDKLKNAYRAAEASLFEERANWVQEKQRILKSRPGEATTTGDADDSELKRLREENRLLKEVGAASGPSATGGKLLLQRLENYERRVKYLENTSDQKAARTAYDEVYDKYSKLLNQFQDYMDRHPEGSAPQAKHKRKHILQLNPDENNRMEQMSSGISSMQLDGVSSDILDNFDSSYSFEVEMVDGVRAPKGYKLTAADQELLKLMNSDIWEFMQDDELSDKISEVCDSIQKEEQRQQIELYDRIRKIKNLSHPQGAKVNLYDNELIELDSLGDSVSVTSALPKDYDGFNSDVQIDLRKLGADAPPMNMRRMKEMSQSLGSDAVVSSKGSWDSGIVKRKKVEEKGSRIRIERKASGQSEADAVSVDSDVSSVNVNEGHLLEIDSSVEGDFRKKRK